MIEIGKKYIFRRKKDGHIIVYDAKNPKEKKQAEYLEKRPGFELVSMVESAEPRAYKSVPVVEDNLECPLCGKVVLDDEALRAHKTEAHERIKIQDSIRGELQPKLGGGAGDSEGIGETGASGGAVGGIVGNSEDTPETAPTGEV